MIEDLKISNEWKIQLTMKMNFVSTTKFVHYQQMYSKNDKSEVMSNFDADVFTFKDVSSGFKNIY